MNTADAFNQSGFSRWINSPYGRIFRICAGIFFLTIGVTYRDSPIGVASIAWSFFPLSAGLFDICYISAVLRGPLSGSKIRQQQS